MDGFDEKLAAACHDVIVPDGLSDRIWHRLAAEQVEKPMAGQRGAIGPFTRRRLLAFSALAVAAGALLVAVWPTMCRTNDLTEQFVLDEAIRAFDLGTDERGRLVAEPSIPDGFPFSASVSPLRGARWREVDGFLGHRSVVYDLPGSAGTAAALYVVQAETVDELPPSPASSPFTTAGCSACAWREGGLLYVLVVRGDPAAYRSYLNLPRSPVA